MRKMREEEKKAVGFGVENKEGKKRGSSINSEMQ